MPNCYFSYDNGTSTFVAASSGYFTATEIQQQYEEYRQRCERQEREMERMHREAEERCYQEMLEQEDRRKYPLFYWRKTCKPIKEK